MVATELLSTGHGQLALKAVHRFISHNPEWVGLTIGAGLAPETEEHGSGLGADYKVRPLHCIAIGEFYPHILYSPMSVCE